MPTFLPRIPFTAIFVSLTPLPDPEFVTPGAYATEALFCCRLLMLFAERLDLDVNAGGKLELHERVHRLLRRLENVEQALMSSDFELLARFLVHVGRTQHAVLVLYCWQRNRSRNLCPCALRGVHDFARGLVENAIIVCFQPDAYSFFANHVSYLSKIFFWGSSPCGLCRGLGTGAAAISPESPAHAAFARDGVVAPHPQTLRNNFGDGAGAHGASAFADGEPQALLHRHRRDQLDLQRHVVARHHHLRARRQRRHSRHVGGAEVELRPIALEEWRVPPAFILRQHVHLALELGVRRDRARLGQNHAALHLVLADAPQQQPGVVARHAFVQLLLEHLHARDHRLARLPEAHNLHFLAHLHLAALDAPRHHRAPARDREDVFDRHQERLVHVARRQRYALVHRLHQLFDFGLPLRFAVERAQRRAPHHRQIVAREAVLVEQFADFHLHQVDQLGIFHRIALVQKHHDVGHAYLAGQQHVLLGLRHGTVGGSDYQNRAVHLRRAGDHVLDVVGVAGTIHVRVVPRFGLVLHVRRGNGDAALALFGRVVDGVERAEQDLGVVLLQDLGDGRRQRGLAMIDVPDRAHVHVRLAAIKFLFRHKYDLVIAKRQQDDLVSTT